MIYDILPPVREKIAAKLKALNLLLKTSKYTFLFLVFGLTLLTASYFFAKYLKISVKAQEQIKIFPMIVSGNWQNKEAIFIQELEEGSGVEQFNKENSAFPF